MKKIELLSKERKIEVLKQEAIKILNTPNLSEEEIRIALKRLLRKEVERFSC